MNNLEAAIAQIKKVWPNTSDRGEDENHRELMRFNAIVKAFRALCEPEKPKPSTPTVVEAGMTFKWADDYATVICRDRTKSHVWLGGLAITRGGEWTRLLRMTNDEILHAHNLVIPEPQMKDVVLIGHNGNCCLAFVQAADHGSNGMWHLVMFDGETTREYRDDFRIIFRPVEGKP